MPGALLFAGSTFDEDCGQGTENERLDAAAEPVEIQARKGRNADLEQLDLAQGTRQPAENDVAQACQRPVQQCGDDRTGQDVAKVTERHADRGGHLRQHIDGCHDEDGVQQTLEVAEDAVRFDLVIHDQNEHHDGPGRLGVQVRRGAPQAHHADQVAPDAQCEDRADERDKYVEENPNIGILKITICDESSIIFGGIIKRLRQISDVDVLDVQHMARKVITSGTEDVKVEYHYTEITSKDVNKWMAIQNLANRLNIKPSEVIAIGDNMNDMEMIENAGLGVIMGNSAEYMHEFADVVAPTNNDDGVAYILEKYL